jgi:4,5-DOPA dioxygenase extradiol
MTLHELKNTVGQLPNTERMPALFVGHGSPLNAIEDNAYVEGWKKLGAELPRPHAILSISAHWLTEGTRVHVGARPKTIHDFFGFPKALNDVHYACDGSPESARAAAACLAPTNVGEDTDWGLDHGTWVVLHRMFPAADIPVFQLSIDIGRSHRAHYELGKLLSPLREKGILIMGSGNIVHNLGEMTWEENAAPFDWASAFDAQAHKLLIEGNHTALIDYAKLGREAELAIPTPEHYWPLLYLLGLQEKNEHITFPVEGIAHGSISMRTMRIG